MHNIQKYSFEHLCQSSALTGLTGKLLMTRFAPASAMNISDNLIIKLAMVMMMMMMMRIPLGVVGGSGPLVGGTIAAWK